MRIAGIDPSLTATAVVLSDPDHGAEAYHLRVFSSKARGDDVRNRIGRMEDLVGRIVSYLEDCAVTHIYLENYSYASKFNVTLLGEFGGLLRWNLLPLGEVWEVAPSTLKKFATGAGNTKGKDLLAAHITKRYGVLLDSSDAYDAFALWRLGRCCQNIDPCETAAQRESVAKVLGVEIPKEKKPRVKKVKEPAPF